MRIADWLTHASGILRGLKEAALENGWELHEPDAKGGWLRIPYRNEWYGLTVHEEGGMVHLVMHSRVRFPGNRIPVEPAKALMERNAEMKRLDWDVLPRSGVFILRAACRAEKFSAPVLRGAAEEMLPEVARVDAALRECGYGV